MSSVSANRRRRTGKRLWIIALLVILVGVGLYLWITGSDATTETSAPSQPAPTVAAQPAPVSPVTSATPTSTPTPTTPRPAAAPATRPAAVAPVSTSPSASSPDTTAALSAGMKLLEQGRLIEARAALSTLLIEPRWQLSSRDAQAIRDSLASVNQRLVFSKQVLAGDPLVGTYTVQSGDVLLRIAPRYHITAELLETINGVDPRKIWVGQTLKVIQGPFHAVVDKSEYRMDVFLPTPGQPDKWVYVRSFPVGVGKDDSTPVGSFVVTPGKKLKNPAWTDPRTGKLYAADDPTNPIGEFWISLDGADEKTRGLKGYGIHGTIEPQSIGTQASMGCIRLGDADVELVYNLLLDGQSTVRIVP